MQELQTLRDQSTPQPTDFLVEGVIVPSPDSPRIYAKVRIPNYHTNIPDSDLPLYRIGQPCSVTGHNRNGLAKQYNRLAQGTPVLVALLDQHGYKGIITHVLPNESTAASPDGLVHGWEDDVGNAVGFMDDGSAFFQSAAGVRIDIGIDGKLTLSSQGVSITSGLVDIASTLMNLTASTLLAKAADLTISSAAPKVLDGTSGGFSGSVTAPTLEPRTMPEPPDVLNKKDW